MKLAQIVEYPTIFTTNCASLIFSDHRQIFRWRKPFKNSVLYPRRHLSHSTKSYVAAGLRNHNNSPPRGAGDPPFFVYAGRKRKRQKEFEMLRCCCPPLPLLLLLLEILRLPTALTHTSLLVRISRMLWRIFSLVPSRTIPTQCSQ